MIVENLPDPVPEIVLATSPKLGTSFLARPSPSSITVLKSIGTIGPDESPLRLPNTFPLVAIVLLSVTWIIVGSMLLNLDKSIPVTVFTVPLPVPTA